MSGHKVATVTISQEEYRKLYEAERDLRYSLNDLSLEVNQSQIEENRSIFDQLLDFNNRQIGHYSNNPSPQFPNHSFELDNIRNIYDGQIKQIQQLLDHQSQYIHDFDKENLELKSTLSDQIIDLRLKLSGVIDQLSQNAIIEEQNAVSINNQVRICINELENCINHLYRYQYHQLFPGDRLIKIEDGLETAVSDAENGFLEPALSLLQSLILEAKELIRKIDLDHMMLTFLSSELMSRTDAIKQTVTVNPVVEAITREGYQSGIFLDLNDWSDGKYQALLFDINNLQTWLDENRDQVSFEELKKYEESVSQFESNFADVIHISRLNAINSQLKYEVANQVLLALISQGYVPEEGNYCEFKGGERYYATAKNGEGSTVTILIDDLKEVPIGNKLSILSSDYQQRTQYELTHRTAEIKEAVSRYGLEIGDLSEVHSPKNNVVVPDKTKATTRINSKR